MGRTVRTNVVLDEDLVGRVMDRYGFKSKREAIHFALEQLVPPTDPWKAALALEGTGWDGDLDAMRDEPVEE